MATTFTDPSILDFIQTQPSAISTSVSLAYGLIEGLRFGASGRPGKVMAFGCGTSLHCAEFASLGAESPDMTVVSLPAYEVWHSRSSVQSDLAIAISHSGETVATIRAAERLRQEGAGTLVGITCVPDSSLARAVDRVIVVPGQDEHVGPKTKGFAACASAAMAIIDGLSGSGQYSRSEIAQEGMRQVLPRTGNSGELATLLEWAREVPHLWVLGAGPLAAVAQEGALKIVEMAGTATRSMEQEEFLHGWRRGTDGNDLVVLLAPDGADTVRLDVAIAFCGEQNARLALIQPDDAPVSADVSLTVKLPFAGGQNAWAVLPYIVPLQLLGFALGTGTATFPRI